MNSRRVFKLGGRVGHMTRHARQLLQVKGQGHKVTQRNLRNQGL